MITLSALSAELKHDPKLARAKLRAAAKDAKTFPELAPGTPIEVWFQDEMRVGQKNKLTYRWAKQPQWRQPDVHPVSADAQGAPKKAATKKAAPKKTAKPAKKAVERRAPADGAKKITVLTKENPRRAGTVQHERYEKLKRFGGKTVEAYLKAGGHRTCLNYAVAGGHAKVG